ncbi:hypothetical protein [Pedobacter heparinus]|uniref:hypothetical protein n=1 Tax=Pedobacter heparinus TaxID=984 RepID=UPI002931E2EA|nr:hypothetical protein [Pedobacter heparinus]
MMLLMGNIAVRLKAGLKQLGCRWLRRLGTFFRSQLYAMCKVGAGMLKELGADGARLSEITSLKVIVKMK